jgi:adenylyltransferase/sulfurtransferase
MAPVVGILGSMQATEVVKLITGAGTSLLGRLVFLDALSMQWQNVRITKNAQCPVCGTG